MKMCGPESETKRKRNRKRNVQWNNTTYRLFADNYGKFLKKDKYKMISFFDFLLSIWGRDELLNYW